MKHQKMTSLSSDTQKLLPKETILPRPSAQRSRSPGWGGKLFEVSASPRVTPAFPAACRRLYQLPSLPDSAGHAPTQPGLLPSGRADFPKSPAPQFVSCIPRSPSSLLHRASSPPFYPSFTLVPVLEASLTLSHSQPVSPRHSHSRS